MAAIHGITVRYVGEHLGANYAAHTEPFTSVRAAVEHLRDDRYNAPGDSIVLWPVSPDESLGECYGHSAIVADATHLVEVGPNYGVRAVRI